MADTTVFVEEQDQFQATLDALHQEIESRDRKIAELEADLKAYTQKDAHQQVYIWTSTLRGVLVVVAANEKQARKIAAERDPLYAKWFLAVRPLVIGKVAGAEVFTLSGGRRS